jgi:hypothetical protein
LQERVVSVYLANKRLIDAAAQSYGFKCLFFWQPNVWTKTNLTAYESKQRWLPGEQQFIDGIYRRIAMIPSPGNLQDLSAVFGDSAKPFYIDEAHITEEGNRIVAQAMLPSLLQVLKEGPLQRTQSSASSKGFALPSRVADGGGQRVLGTWSVEMRGSRNGNANTHMEQSQ